MNMSKVKLLSKKIQLGGLLVITSAFTHVANADFFISSFGTNELMKFNEATGEYLGVVGFVDGPFASQIGFDGDLFISSFNTGEVLRFDSETGESKGVFISSGSGGLTNPTAPNFGPDGKVYVGDLASNRVLRYDAQGNFLDVFADPETSDIDGPFMQTFDESTMFIASGYTNSILRYDLETKEYLGAFVAPGSGGLVVPVGLEFGPDGNLYTSSSGTSAVLRYDGETGAFIDEFVPPGGGGMDSPRAIRFGGPNTDLYVVSSNTNNVLQYDRVTGEFIGVIASDDPSGFVAPRGLTFSPRPEFFIDAEKKFKFKRFVKIKVDHKIRDFSDNNPTIKLDSIEVDNETIDLNKAVRGANYGEEDYHFFLQLPTPGEATRTYSIKYSATNELGYTTLATDEITLKSN